ncbi:MAG TPA: methionyl-tRNA formyltransferase [Gammaproteobacteria bacterium]|nr:methionyl-tRNA formyltransferase [Gammaproteobacteria bacterium]
MIDSIVLFLNGQRGVVVLDYLLQEGRNVVAIVAPEKSVFWEIAEKYNKKYLIKETQINNSEFVKKLTLLNPDIFIVSGFQIIFKQPILSIPRLGVINLHGGYLPKYRGGSPLNWQIINDENKIGVSIIFMDKGIDTGDILAEEYFDLTDQDDIHSVHHKANIAFVRLVSQVLVKFENNKLNLKKQNQLEAQYWIQRSEQDSFIDWNEVSARQAFNLIRALKLPYPPVFTYINNRKVFLYEAVVPTEIIKGRPGRVVYLQGKGPYIICKDHAILITKSSEELISGMYLND